MVNSEKEQSQSGKKFAEKYASVRNTLLRRANLCMELPQAIIQNPPSNAAIEHCFLHSIQRNGFEVNYDLGTGDKDPSSRQQCPFEGTIYGKQFSNKITQATPTYNQNFLIVGCALIVLFVVFLVLYLLSSIYVYGALSPLNKSYALIYLILGIIFLIGGIGIIAYTLTTGTNAPSKELINITFTYWALNYYKTYDDKTPNTNLNTGEEIIYGYHPIQTCIHITIGMEQKGKIDSSELESLATRVINTFSQELFLQPKKWETITPADINSVKFLDQRKSNGDLYPLDTRFPF